MLVANVDGSVDLYHNNSKKFETHSAGVKVSAGNLYLDRDDAKVVLGASDDLQIYHDGSDSYISDTGTGGLYLSSNQFLVRNAAGNELQIQAVENAGVQLYYNGSEHFKTTSAGATVSGALTVTGDVSCNGGAGAVTIAGDSDIRFNNGDWTGNSCKIQHHDNSLYIQAGAHGTHAIVFRNVTGSNRWYMNPDGDFFPTDDNDVEIGTSSNRVQNIYMAGGVFLGGTGSANYLDHYEEGTWTPTLRGGSNDASGYSIRDGSYTRVGRMVNVSFAIAITGKGSMSGDLHVVNMPSQVAVTGNIISGTSIEASGICGYWKHVSPNSSHITLVADQSNGIYLRHTVGAEDDPDQMQASDIDSDFTVRGTITYFTDA